MKKSLLLLLVAMMLPMLMGAMDLADNQRILGHYTTDDLSTTGWGKTGAKGVLSIAIEFSADELALYQGSKIVALRVGLAKTTPVTRVFVVPVDGDGNCGEFAEWSCDVSEVGWNLIELATPYDLNLPADYSLRIGFDYEQKTSVTKPLSVVNVGTTYPAFYYRDGNWTSSNLDGNGNLSLQCIVEADNFADYAIRMRSLWCKSQLKVGEDLPFQFQTCRLGNVEVPAGACTYEIAVDGNVVSTMTNNEPLNNSYVTLAGSINTAGLGGGMHTLTITAVSLNGEPLAIKPSVSSTFKAYEFGFTRQMHLFEELTSNTCTYCPLGASFLNVLMGLRGDIAMVAIHGNQSGVDPTNTAQCDTLFSYMGAGGWPYGVADRSTGWENNRSIAFGIGYNEPYQQEAAEEMSSFLDYLAEESPSYATVNINSTFDAETRKAVVTVDGELIPGFDGVMGADCKLTVYLTESGLVYRQLNQGTWVNNYVHNHVLRLALGSVLGVQINKVDETNYRNTFELTLPSDWNADNMEVVAFISRPLANGATRVYTDMAVNQANKRKFGEFDEPTVVIGDLTGDSILNVADVTALIGAILNGDTVDLDVADLSGDGLVNVADVTALITLVLNGQ